MKDLEFQAIKEAGLKTNPKNIIIAEYHNLLDVFSKKNLIYFPWPIENMMIKSY